MQVPSITLIMGVKHELNYLPGPRLSNGLSLTFWYPETRIVNVCRGTIGKRRKKKREHMTCFVSFSLMLLQLNPLHISQQFALFLSIHQQSYSKRNSPVLPSSSLSIALGFERNHLRCKLVILFIIPPSSPQTAHPTENQQQCTYPYYFSPLLISSSTAPV